MDPPRIVRVDWLIERGMLSEFSPTTLLCRRIGIKWLMLWEGFIYGPTPGLAEVLDLLLTRLKPKSMIDLYCGSGAFSKLAFMRGVREIVCVDRFAEAARRNLRGLGVEVVEGDALSYSPGRVYDLVVADPPEELVERIIKDLGRLRRLMGKIAVIWLGPYHRAGGRIRRLGGRRMVRVVEAWGDALALLWKPGYRERVESVARLME